MRLLYLTISKLCYLDHDMDAQSESQDAEFVKETSIQDPPNNSIKRSHEDGNCLKEPKVLSVIYSFSVLHFKAMGGYLFHIRGNLTSDNLEEQDLSMRIKKEIQVLLRNSDKEILGGSCVCTLDLFQTLMSVSIFWVPKRAQTMSLLEVYFEGI